MMSTECNMDRKLQDKLPKIKKFACSIEIKDKEQRGKKNVNKTAA